MKSEVFTEETVSKLVKHSNAMFSREDLNIKKDRLYSDLTIK